MSHATLPAARSHAALPLPPGPRGQPFFGSIADYRRDLLGLYRRAALEYGDIVRIRFFGADTFAFSHPDHFKYILQDRNRNYRRNAFLNGIVRLFLGDSLFTTDGDDWLSRRRLMQPAFHRQRIAGFGGLMAEAAQTALREWDARPDGQRLELDQAMMALTLRVAGQALFSVDLHTEAAALGAAFTGMSEYLNYRMGSPFQPPAWVPTRGNRLYNRTRRTLDEKIYALIRARRASAEEHNDLLGMMMAARDADTGETMSDVTLRNEVLVMMFAGHETTAAALTWAFSLLARHPEAEAKLHAELDTVLGGRAPSLADLPNLPYTRRVVDETLRLYPPAWGVGRQQVEADEIGGYRLPANSSITLVINNIHHDPRFWDAPEQFDPDRFLPERSASRHPFAYLPFGAGPRQCIGNQFALTEAHLVLAASAQRYQFRLIAGHPVQPRPVFVLRTSHGLPVTARRR
jgi:cytochrome P450